MKDLLFEKFKREWLYEFDHDNQGLNAGVLFIMNDQLFRVIETEGTKIRAKKITMKTKKHKVKIPPGHEYEKTLIRDAHNTDGKPRIYKEVVFKPIHKELPRTWEEFFRKNGDDVIGRDVFAPNEYAKALSALAKLLQLRDVYNDGRVPDWIDECKKYCIYMSENKLYKGILAYDQKILAFKSIELRNEFYSNFESLIIEAKPLL